jgi:radical SAM protein (TIGR04043 family)
MDALTLKTHLLCRGLNGGNREIIDGRKGGAGPAGTCIEVEDFIVNIPTTENVTKYSQIKLQANGTLRAEFGGDNYQFNQIQRPDYYDKITSGGIPMKKIALLHGTDCLATTLYQGCMLMDMGGGCGFCAIETSLNSNATVLRKTPEQLEEVASEAIKEGVTHLTITTGIPNLRDHGTGMIASVVSHLKDCFDIPIHVQLTPPQKEQIEVLYNAGADTIGLHVESFDRKVLKQVCPAKFGFDYPEALKNAVDIFGVNQVSSFVLGGLGEDPVTLDVGFEKLASLGVIPFLVPFRPLPGAALQDRQPPEPFYMEELYITLADALKTYGIDIKKNLAGCVRCGACSAIDVAMDGLE